MSTEGKVLTFPKRKKTSDLGPSDSKNASVVDMVEKRQAMIQDERRSVKRTILTEFIGVHLVLPGQGLQKCSLHDISVNGVAFDLTKKQGQFRSGEQVVMRVYLNHRTYFSFVVSVRSSRFIEEEGVYRHGASLVKGTVNEKAIEHFISFLESVSALLKTDHGDVIVSNLDQP